MAKNDLSSLLRRRQTIASQVAELNKELSEIDVSLERRFSVLALAFEGDAPPVPADGVWEQPGSISVWTKVRAHAPSARANRLSKLAPVVKNILKEENRPMRTKELLAKLREREFTLTGKNPLNNLSAHLSNSDEFESTESGWVVKGEQPFVVKIIGGKEKAPH